MNNVEDFVWTPAEVAQICINHQDDVELAIEKIYERKTVPKEESANHICDKTDDEIMSESGSDITDSGASDMSNSSLNDLKLKKRSSILMRAKKIMKNQS